MVCGKAKSSYKKFVSAAKECAQSYIDWMNKSNFFFTFATNIMPATLRRKPGFRPCSVDFTTAADGHFLVQGRKAGLKPVTGAERFRAFFPGPSLCSSVLGRMSEALAIEKSGGEFFWFTVRFETKRSASISAVQLFCCYEIECA